MAGRRGCGWLERRGTTDENRVSPAVVRDPLRTRGGRGRGRVVSDSIKISVSLVTRGGHAANLAIKQPPGGGITPIRSRRLPANPPPSPPLPSPREERRRGGRRRRRRRRRRVRRTHRRGETPAARSGGRIYLRHVGFRASKVPGNPSPRPQLAF